MTDGDNERVAPKKQRRKGLEIIEELRNAIANRRMDRAEAERDALRAELAAERTRYIELLDEMDVCCDYRTRLRAELAAEREAHEILLAERNMRHFQMTQSIRAERDELRALLREAREYTGYAAFYGDRIEADHAVDLCARIDAALNKGGGDE